MKQRIMPLTGCSLEIRGDSFVTVQPYKDNQYESCRIYYKEVETLVKTKNGVDLYQNFAVRREHDSGEPENRGERCLSVRSDIPEGGDRKIYEVLKERVFANSSSIRVHRITRLPYQEY